MAKIKAAEEERSDEPTDAITVSCNVSSRVEACSDYVEDPLGKLARNARGQLIRQKVQISLSYSSGLHPTSPHFSNVQL